MKTFDRKCFTLAQAFLEDGPTQSYTVTRKLAEAIQTTIEDFLADLHDPDLRKMIESPGFDPELKVSLDRYAKDRVECGGFLTAVLENNFMEAACRADDDNREKLMDIAKYVYNELPSDCWGSKEKVKAWLEAKPCA